MRRLRQVDAVWADSENSVAVFAWVMFLNHHDIIGLCSCPVVSYSGVGQSMSLEGKRVELRERGRGTSLGLLISKHMARILIQHSGQYALS